MAVEHIERTFMFVIDIYVIKRIKKKTGLRAMQFNAQVLNPVFLYKPCCLLVTVYCILPILFSKVTTSRDLYSLIYPTKPVLCIN